MSLLDRVLGRSRSVEIAPVVRDPDVYFVRIDGQAFEFTKRVSEAEVGAALDEHAGADELRRFACLALPTAPAALIRRLDVSELRRIPGAYRSVFREERA